MSALIIIRSILMIAAIVVLTLTASAAIFTDNLEVDENYFSSGTLDIAASPAKAAISMENMKPGDKTTKTITVINDGNLDFSYDLVAKKDAGITDFYNVLEARVEKGHEVLYEGPMKNLLGFSTGRRRLAPSTSEDLSITVSLPLDVDASLSKKYTKVAFQLAAEQL